MVITEASGGADTDLHGNNVFLSICNQDGANVFRRRVKANLDAVNAALDPLWDHIRVLGIESTFNWYWFVNGLIEQGRNVKVGNPAKMEHSIPDHVLERFVGFADFVRRCPNSGAIWREKTKGYFCQAQGSGAPLCTSCRLDDPAGV